VDEYERGEKRVIKDGKWGDPARLRDLEAELRKETSDPGIRAGDVRNRGGGTCYVLGRREKSTVRGSRSLS